MFQWEILIQSLIYIYSTSYIITDSTFVSSFILCTVNGIPSNKRDVTDWQFDKNGFNDLIITTDY